VDSASMPQIMKFNIHDPGSFGRCIKRCLYIVNVVVLIRKNILGSQIMISRAFFV